MLCRRCRRQLAPGAAFCATCGAPTAAGAETAVYELVLRDGTRVPIEAELTIGRAPGNTITMDDPSVSRHHLVVRPGATAPSVQDAGSSHGSWLDGERLDGPRELRDGSVVQAGDVVLRVERRRSSGEAGRTLVVPSGRSVLARPGAPADGDAPAPPPGGLRPRVRAGYALKRLDASEGERRVILRDLDGGGFVRMSDEDAVVFELLDGSRRLPELVAETERRVGPSGPLRLMGLLSDLGARGMLEGVEADAGAERTGLLSRLLRPREWTFSGAGRRLARLYERGGWVLFTRPAWAILATIATLGLGAFAYLIIGRYGTPFVVASHIGLGGLVFLAGRFLVAAAHETAHGLTVASFGRRVGRAGLKVLLIFPYAFVDTSEAWFEPRRRRMAIAAAGPASDLVVGGAFALGAALLSKGPLRDILYQVALGAYIGALVNLNPLLDRDGYQILVDALGEPGLRRRARTWLSERLSGRPTDPGERRPTAIYAAAGIAWSLLAVGFAVILSTRYYDRIVALGVPRFAVTACFAAVYVAMLFPVFLTVGRPLLERRRARAAAT